MIKKIRVISRNISMFLGAFAILATAQIASAEVTKQADAPNKNTTQNVAQKDAKTDKKPQSSAQKNTRTSGAVYTPAKAIEGVSYAKPWQFNFGPSATEVKSRLHGLHNFLLVIITVITIFVLLLLVYTCVRFRAKANPIPSKTTHNVLIEIIWVVIPILILVAILIPSWRLINFMDKAKNPEITLKAIGYQWYWGYEYMDGVGKGIKFESYMKKPEDLKAGEPRLLETDRRVVLPINTDIRVLTTANDVIHAFAVPAFGVKADAVPGRINETWFNIQKTGVYYGQCSELCGSGHAFMPIAIEAVEPDVYAAWVAENKGELEPKTLEEDKIKVKGTNALSEQVKKDKEKK
jgi:cytochrome c oxidase subunit II